MGTPTFILHVDEYHDMLSDQLPMRFGEFIYFVMRKWSNCRVCWLTKNPIDDPAMWLSEDAWESVRASHRRPEVRLETAAWRVFPAAIAAFGNEPSPLPRALWTAPNKVDAEGSKKPIDPSGFGLD